MSSRRGWLEEKQAIVKTEIKSDPDLDKNIGTSQVSKRTVPTLAPPCTVKVSFPLMQFINSDLDLKTFDLFLGYRHE